MAKTDNSVQDVKSAMNTFVLVIVLTSISQIFYFKQLIRYHIHISHSVAYGRSLLPA